MNHVFGNRPHKEFLISQSAQPRAESEDESEDMSRGHLDPVASFIVTIPRIPVCPPPTFSLPHLPNIQGWSRRQPGFIPCLGSLEVLTSPAALPAIWWAVGHPAASVSTVSPQGTSNGTSALRTGLKHTDRYGSQQTKGTRKRSLHHDRGGSWRQGPPEQTQSPKPRTSEDLLNADYSPTILISQNIGLPSLPQNTKYLHSLGHA